MALQRLLVKWLVESSAIEKQLIARGELPANASLELSREYLNMSGDGELWLTADGLPSHQVLRLSFPPLKAEAAVRPEVVVNFGLGNQPIGTLASLGFWESWNQKVRERSQARAGVRMSRETGDTDNKPPDHSLIRCLFAGASPRLLSCRGNVFRTLAHLAHPAHWQTSTNLIY
ncbi:MAG: hypothetical protein HY675_02210 [Chloroflexi bacterium]|nr:hypothetical protein [Chloroflexota bacterium]